MSSLISGATDIVSKGVTNAVTALLGQGIRDDDNLFCSDRTYFFELRVPNGAAGGPGSKSFYFPLALNPDSISFSEPYAMDATPTLGGGLIIEESGIVQRSIRLRGQTGSYQRTFSGDVGQLGLVSSDKRTFGRPLAPNIQGALSGQKIFQYLNDAVFRVYADLKRDAATATGTSLIFHMPKEMEAWEVSPSRFSCDRSAGRPLDYPYEIELVVVQKAELQAARYSPDKATLDFMRNPLQVAAVFLKRANASVNALTAAQAQLRNYVRQLDVILVQASALISSVGAFVAGTVDLIEVPASEVRLLASTIADALATLVASESALKAVPHSYEQSLRQLENATLYLSLHPDSFVQASAAARQAEAAVRAFVAAEQAAEAQAVAAAAVALPSRSRLASPDGTALSAEQVAQIQTANPAGSGVVQYTGTHSYRVQAGDTLANLAARYLGDARLWRYIAAANSLHPPYMGFQAQLPLLATGASVDVSGLALGDTIAIPDFSTPASEQPDIFTLGVSPDAPAAERTFGSDLALAVQGPLRTDSRTLADGQKLDWVVDKASGGTRLAVATGLDNLTQGILTRVSVQRGEDPMYPDLGTDPLVGSGISAVDGQTLAFSLRESLTQDPRVAQVLDLSVQTSAAGDGVYLTGSVQAQNFTDPVPVSVPLAGA